MQNTSKTINWKKALQVASLGVFAMGTAASTLPAQADPADRAPAWGYRNKDRDYKSDRRYDRDGDGDYDRDDRRYDNNNRNFRTLEGIVTDDNSGRDFTIRLRNGSSYNSGNRVRVFAQDGEPSRLSEGDLVRVYGYFQNNNTGGTFIARSVNIVRQDVTDRYDDGDDNDRRSFNATVSNVDRNSRRLTVYANNRSFTVYARNSFSSSINRGDRVRVTGDINNSTVRDARVELLSNNNGGSFGGYGGYGGNSQISFPATVVDTRDRSDTLRVRGDNGREYSVRWRNSDDYDRGDRVRVRGYYEDGIIIASDVDRIR
jgi:hypothetical protein